MVRKKTVCNRAKIKPTPNSTAESSKKKNVSVNKLRLLYTQPATITKRYKVTQSTSAVKSKCTEVFTLITIVIRIVKNKSSTKLISPNNIINKTIKPG